MYEQAAPAARRRALAIAAKQGSETAKPRKTRLRASERVRSGGDFNREMRRGDHLQVDRKSGGFTQTRTDSFVGITQSKLTVGLER
ncbi:hypothetical protein HA50_17770 [Pantoea cypripedii]|uniref:Uncharacterized protein n=1 Tax=Pantoea cypripedii TaxID=55209 RepID=A0A1X1EYV8_PANCY|nr:hypothetical protein HA50_17770 [Pantoea cypripedii]